MSKLEIGQSHEMLLDRTAPIIKAMRPWYCHTEGPKIVFADMRSNSAGERTDQQKIWDHAIITAAELVRRLEGDEVIATQIHQLLSSYLPKDGAAK